MIKLILLCILLSVNLEAGENSHHFLSDNIVSMYKFNSSSFTHDESGNRNFLISGGISNVSGRFENCINNNNTGYLELGNSNIYNLPEFTISFWYKLKRGNTNNLWIMTCDDGINTGGQIHRSYGVYVWITTDGWYRLNFQIFNGDPINDGSGGWNIYPRQPSGIHKYQDRWEHIVLIMSNFSPQRLYHNGKLCEGDTTTKTMKIGANTPVYIGRRGDGTEFFNGKLDEFVFYNKALTSGEAQRIYLNSVNRRNIVK